jgi:DNA-binding NtrC family response regulator
VRELRNVLQRAWVMTVGQEIGDQWLPRDVLADPVRTPSVGTLEVAVGTTLAAMERQMILATLEHSATKGTHGSRPRVSLNPVQPAQGLRP